MFILEMSGDFESSQLGHTKYWLDYFGQIWNGSSTLPGSQKLLHNYIISRERLFYQSMLVQKISLSKLAFLNSGHRILFPLPVFEIVHHILKVVNVLKRSKPSEFNHSGRGFIANNFLTLAYVCRQLHHFSLLL